MADSVFADFKSAVSWRSYARQLNLRNRIGQGNLRVKGGMVYLDYAPGPRCQCGNLLTIIDRGSRCRQCVLEQ